MQSLKTEHIEIVVNGIARTVPRDITLTGLLQFIDVVADRVAIELDGAIVRKQDWPATAIAAGSKLEIVQFVGGG